MILGNAGDVLIGNMKVNAVYLGNFLIFERFVKVKPSNILLPSTISTKYVEILANTDWKLNPNKPIPGWLNVQPTSGKGSKDWQKINNKTNSNHTGRLNKSTAVEIMGSNGSNNITYNVVQLAKPEFVSAVNASVNVNNNASTITIKVKSNSEKLTYSITQGDFVTLAKTYTVGSTNVNNGNNITGDPGATAEYEASINLTIAANTTIKSRTSVILVTTGNNSSCLINVVLAAGESYITVTPNSIIIPEDGSAVSVKVNSNTKWTVVDG